MALMLMRIVLVVVLFLFIGCSPKIIAIDQTTKQMLIQGARLTVIHSEPNDFHVPLAHWAHNFGLIGAIAAAVSAESRSDTVLEKNQLIDPIFQIKEEFKQKLLSEFPSVSYSQLDEFVDDDDIDELHKQFKSQILLDFRTTMWGIFRQEVPWYKPRPYRSERVVKYAARAALRY